MRSTAHNCYLSTEILKFVMWLTLSLISLALNSAVSILNIDFILLLPAYFSSVNLSILFKDE